MLPSLPPPGRSIVLSGPMGAGKSTVAKALAARLGLPCADLDERVTERTGTSVSALFATHGEAHFRALEASLCRELLDGPPQVLALGGGTVTNQALRHELLERTLLVTLQAPLEVLLARVGEGAARPLLAGGAHERLAHLLDARRAAYAEAHFALDSSELPPEELAEIIARETARTQVAVALGERSYRVEFVRDQPSALIDAMVALAPSQLIVVSDSNVMRLRRGPLDAALDALLLPRTLITLPPGEPHKTLHSVGAIWDAALGAKVDRDALVIAYGGGVVGDLAGFAAATLLRGVKVLQVPTTSLSMLDSSVGGKTGFDHAMGKNLIGAMWQPSAVLVDLAHLTTLAPRELRAGLAELVKIAFTHDAALLTTLEGCAEALAAGDLQALERVIPRGVALKAGVVRRDEHERGERALLNFGHTVGHALETEGNYSHLLHGEAVGLGLIAELEAAAALGLAPRELAARATALLTRLQLPVLLEPEFVRRALRHTHSDKKRRHGGLGIAAFDAVGRARVEQVPHAQFLDAVRGLFPA